MSGKEDKEVQVVVTPTTEPEEPLADNLPGNNNNTEEIPILPKEDDTDLAERKKDVNLNADFDLEGQVPIKRKRNYEDLCLVVFCWILILSGYGTNIIDWVVLQLYTSFKGFIIMGLISGISHYIYFVLLSIVYSYLLNLH